MHIPAVALLIGLCAGWFAGARSRDDAGEFRAVPWWIKWCAVMPLLAGMALVASVLREAPAEYRALLSENFLCSGDSGKAWDEAVAGLSLRSSNPRLLLLAAESAGQLGDAAPSPEEKREWHSRASAYFDEVIRERPFFSYAWRERALALDYQARFSEALPVHLRAIARDPDHARGYEYLAYYYWLQGRKQEARRLLYLAQTLTGSFLAADLLRLLEADRDSL